ncbi:MAG: PilC/PilY family type IV pilus protein, partial [Deltaproteobacteria bacterium]|nr:PilC/PilY family type IV pilus protein [Deltaproteobacteria bacterium]
MKPHIRKSFFVFFIGTLLLFGGGNVFAQEEALFTSVAPDALLVLDLSGSMRWTPNGERMYVSSTSGCSSTTAPFYNNSGTGHTLACDIDPYGTVPRYAANGSCAEPFYRQSGTGHTVDCSRLAIAKRAIFDVLDDNNSNTITSADETSLGIRVGYMRYYDCSGDETNGDYNNGCIKVSKGISSKYSGIFCNSSSSCSPTSASSPSVNSESATGGTPLASALNEARLYLDAHKAADTSRDCRQKFAILLSDGADTYACGGSGSEDQTTQYKRGKATVARAKALADAGYRTFVIGFGAPMAHWSRNTLNWAAYYGGTDNPLVINSGDTTAFTPAANFCDDSPTDHHNIDGDGDHYFATTGDPAELPLSGYAFMASNAAELTAALRQAIDMIRESNYSFSLSSVSSQRTQDENYLYEASFQPRNRDPYWFGHLKKYVINADGTIGTELWDAGSVLQNRSADSRVIKTLLGGTLTNFTTANISKEVLGVATDTERDTIVGFFRGSDPPNPEFWKLGDIFRSNPVTLGTPADYFSDVRDANGAYGTFRSAHQRPSTSGNRVIVAGANDGQLHGFRTSDGAEVWSFIPPNFLMKLKNVAHDIHPTGLSHQYFVDGPISAADVWLGVGTGLSKSSSDWKTVLIFGEGRGGGSVLWSSAPNCDSGFSATYDLTHPYFCGYYALDVTNPTSFDAGTYKWRLNPSVIEAPYLGEPWSKMVVGRVKINGN